ncbi:MAG: hypothetical protein WKF75_12080 [Singulisphaera sp.]
MVFDSKRPWLFAGLAALAIVGLGWPQSAEAQLKVSVRAQSQPQVMPAPGVAAAEVAVATRLSPDLQAAVAAEATFLGTAENGDAILDIPGTVTIEGAQGPGGRARWPASRWSSGSGSTASTNWS